MVYIEVVEFDTNKTIVRKGPYESLSRADKIIDGMLINMDVKKYYAQTFETECEQELI
jgi:hypothetical protein